MNSFRFCIFAAVSTDEQATDKGSLDSQVELSRSEGVRLGGVESVGPFVADGYSRSGYYNLDDALNDIPPLKQCIASMPKYDVLIVKNFDRLGSLGMMIYNLFAKHRKQLHSVQQSTPIYPPNEYDPNRDTSVPMMINMAGGTQIYRIQKIVDAFKVGNPRRAREGKFANTFPYGYIRQDSDTLIIDPPVAELLRKFPTWFLAGVTVSDIARRANESGIPPRLAKSWNHDTVRYILQNPFYAGKTFYGRGELDLETRHYKVREKYDLHEGRHEALWTWDTHLQIMAEMKRRRRYKSKPSDYNFTKLLQCSECGCTLSIVYSSKKPQNKFWRCLNGGHVQIAQRVANQLVADELVRILKDKSYTPTPEKESRDYSRRELGKIETQLRRLEQAYDAGAYTPMEFAEKKKGLKARQEELQDAQRQQADARRRIADKQRSLNTLREILPGIHKWIAERNPRIVNFHLAKVVKLTVSPDKTIQGELI